jgi:hypothetical protein
MSTDEDKKIPRDSPVSQRDMFKVAGAGAAAVGLSASDTTSAQAQELFRFGQTASACNRAGNFFLPASELSVPRTTAGRGT